MLFNMVTGAKAEAQAEAGPAPWQEAPGRSRSPPACRLRRAPTAADGEAAEVLMRFARGARVKIRGFVVNSDFNGSDGKVVEITLDRRYHVSLLGKLQGITLRWVKQDNLEHISEAQAGSSLLDGLVVGTGGVAAERPTCAVLQR
ncbi:unnamed protein product [Prorocentrum cordatum]|uniref:Uncharacterized protein n=1 Tax=Prorocentrum cordatum TaxID=2364126 RepID=A0ABN9UK16_9DINO|nr:unnamed protein product [Polarella glacialis]